MRLILLLFIIGTFLFSKQSALTILQPQKNSVSKEAFSSVVVKVPSKYVGSTLLIKSATQEEKFVINKQRDVYCKSLSLTHGVNQFTIQLIDKNNKVITTKKSTVFLNDEVFSDGVNIPEKYSTKLFHNVSNEQKCKRCHDMDIDKVDNKKSLSNITMTNKNSIVNMDKISNVNILEDTSKSKCYTCHNNLLSRGNSHAPSVNFACLQCHTGQTNALNEELKGQSRFLAPDPIDVQCKNCHWKVEDKWYKRESKHGPVMTGRCTKCHNPHSSNHEFFLRKPIWELCTTCHSEKAKGRHVLTSFVFARNKGAHPTQGRPDPVRPGRELVCSGCHNPHGSDGIYLLRTDGKQSYSVCKRCHKK